jgi:uncharacterized protein (DUF1810 family)
MRVSPCGFLAKTLEEAKFLSACVTEVTHDHPEGMKGAEATAVAVYLATIGKSKEEIKKYITENYYDINFTLDEIRPHYFFDVSCQGSVPQALEAFFESTDYVDTIRNAISIGGDSDTIAAIAGGVAEAYYGIPDTLKETIFKYYLDENFKETADKFYQRLRNLHPTARAFLTPYMPPLDNPEYDLGRFLEAQKETYPHALAEIKSGRKRTHWMWFIFPQLFGLGFSHNSKVYGIAGIEEAKAYINHPILNSRLHEISMALLQHPEKSATEIFGYIDAKKLRSCMTLFDKVQPNDVFQQVLDTFFDGKRDLTTLSLLQK